MIQSTTDKTIDVFQVQREMNFNRNRNTFQEPYASADDPFQNWPQVLNTQDSANDCLLIIFAINFPKNALQTAMSLIFNQRQTNSYCKEVLLLNL